MDGWMDGKGRGRERKEKKGEGGGANFGLEWSRSWGFQGVGVAGSSPFF